MVTTTRQRFEAFLEDAKNAGHDCEFPLKLREALGHIVDEIDGLRTAHVSTSERVSALVDELHGLGNAAHAEPQSPPGEPLDDAPADPTAADAAAVDVASEAADV